MKVYHGSLEIVEHPAIRKANRTLDYGTGFYLTSSYEQAEAWVHRKLGLDSKLGYVNVYEYNLEAESGLKVIDFETPTEQWLDFVMANRMDLSFNHNYDIVKGPVANDRVYAAFAIYEAGLLDKSGLIAELKAYKLVNQILLHTERALASINFIEAREVRL